MPHYIQKCTHQFISNTIPFSFGHVTSRAPKKVQPGRVVTSNCRVSLFLLAVLINKLFSLAVNLFDRSKKRGAKKEVQYSSPLAHEQSKSNCNTLRAQTQKSAIDPGKILSTAHFTNRAIARFLKPIVFFWFFFFSRWGCGHQRSAGARQTVVPTKVYICKKNNNDK